MSETDHDDRSAAGSVKVLFRLQRDAEGYPPYEVESLWARSVGPDRYELDNIPFFAPGVSCRDIVSATQEHDALYFKKVVKRSGHSTVRVIVFDETEAPRLRSELRKLGCSSELSMLRSLITVDVPPTVSYDTVAAFLEEGVRADRWECDESNVVHEP